jgi:hypothetical protein
VLDRLDQLGVAAFYTQKLCVRLRSEVTVLSRRGDRRDHLTLCPAQMAGSEHELSNESAKRAGNPWMSPTEARHGRQKPKVVRIPGVASQALPDLLFGRDLNPGNTIVVRHVLELLTLSIVVWGQREATNIYFAKVCAPPMS